MRLAVIPSNGRACLADCVHAIADQVDRVIIINTGEARWVHGPTIYHHADVLGQVNISSWWNQGLDIAAKMAEVDGETEWDVAVLNDDAIVPPGWMQAVQGAMIRGQAVAGCSGNHDVVLRSAEAVPLDMRMQGFAFVLNGERGVRANENLHWYFTDDHIDWESRKAGGMAMVSGWPVDHLYPNGQLSPELHEQIARDAQTFVDIHGRRPW
jgi:hypothetical protein